MIAAATIFEAGIPEKKCLEPVMHRGKIIGVTQKLGPVMPQSLDHRDPGGIVLGGFKAKVCRPH